jgi:2-succinyl-5-enolpyruvyl-6-hydroxy-3-cyclohexene-1-carboxylate synthase
MRIEIADLIETCYQRGIEWFVICPGSRSAPLTLALARHPRLKTLVIPDERVAGFTALGMAQQSGKTLGLVCTSGTAVLNFAPAIAEAFFQEVPLLVLTADRPPEWIGQQDGQTLYQQGVYGRNVKASFQLPVEVSHPDALWYWQRTVNEALSLCQLDPLGPVHLNIPMREPLYPAPDASFPREMDIRLIRQLSTRPSLDAQGWEQVQELWEESPKKLIVVAQQEFSPTLVELLRQVQEEWEIPVVADIVSNLHVLPDTIRHADLLLMRQQGLEDFRPDLLLTFGKSLVSKNVKLFLRRFSPRFHLHLQEGGYPADPFRSLTHFIQIRPEDFLKTLFEYLYFMRFQGGEEPDPDSGYAALWKKADLQVRRKLEQMLQGQPFSELEAVKQVMEALPEQVELHLGNSMPVRYANFVSLMPSSADSAIRVWANRGTSGIDGTSSTALGAARMTDKLVVLITGDVAFFYDRNAFWQPELPANLRILLLNNHGGGIFRLIDAGAQPEVETFFETPHQLEARSLAGEMGMHYQVCHSRQELALALKTFFAPYEKAFILEVDTNGQDNVQVYKALKSVMQEL